MRLINIETLEFEEYFDDQIPPYAILSHRWTDDEISFADYRKGRRKDCAGYQKVLNLCEATKQYNVWLSEEKEKMTAQKNQLPSSLPPWGFKYRTQLLHVWLDTCCIDKRSSAELSEATNAMWTWYSRAQVCLVHLADYVWSSEEGFSASKASASEWFIRGWTLQEMLAPTHALFYDVNWRLCFHKCVQYTSSDDDGPKCGLLPPSTHINEELATITGVDRRFINSHYCLVVEGPLLAADVFRWASTRRTSRKEDVAYCLLGLLQIHMPLEYGEGERAFRRLQEELLRTRKDDSLFAFTSSNLYLYAGDIGMHGSSMLAESPSGFAPLGPPYSFDA